MAKPVDCDPRSLLPVFHILLALADGARHGCGIILEIERGTLATARKLIAR